MMYIYNYKSLFGEVQSVEKLNVKLYTGAKYILSPMNVMLNLIAVT